MNEYVQLTIVLGILTACFMGLMAWRKRMQNRLPVIGIDPSHGSCEMRYLPKNKHGGVTWHTGGESSIHLTLDGAYAYRSPKGPVYLANIREGRGCVMRVADDGSSLGLDGQRLWFALFGGGLKDIAESSKNDINKTLTILMIGGGVLLITVLAALVYLIKLFQDANAVVAA